MSMVPVKVGLLGFGLGGSVFHASLISEEPRLALTVVATSRADEVRRRFPQVAVCGSPAEVIADPAVDQALLLFGHPQSITGDLVVQRPGARSPDYFALTLHYGVWRVLLSGSTLVADARPRFALYGSRGSFVKQGIDPQENSLRAGVMYGSPGFGEDDESLYGVLTVGSSAPERIRTQRGDWRPFYAGVAAAIVDGAAPPVDPLDAVAGLELIELGRRSAEEGRTLAAGVRSPG